MASDARPASSEQAQIAPPALRGVLKKPKPLRPLTVEVDDPLATSSECWATPVSPGTSKRRPPSPGKKPGASPPVDSG
ncbi:hypothetical protein CYMTET_54923 [Cymbomonas tetramitiformis]|uniref:Uncharacterized protein n=1 Tax=Cymbomonas tetramitiformis TaxID=36881 RepID=A0AAE0BFC1_9CHLO|nr:hypothetical protein CYMTET_54923 [Cymbomonas tetramitiformis]